MAESVSEVLELLEFKHKDCECGDCWMRKVKLFRIRYTHPSQSVRDLIAVNLEARDPPLKIKRER